MPQTPWTPPDKTQLAVANMIVEPIMSAATSERGVHAETAIASAARLAGTFLFRGFGLPETGAQPGDAVLSDLANEQGPPLVDTLRFGLQAFGVVLDQGRLGGEIPPDKHSQFSVIETQELLEARITGICRAAKLSLQQSAHACALAAAKLISMAASVLDPHVAFLVAAYGFVEGSKTMPIPQPDIPPPAHRPWYLAWKK